MNLLVLIVVTTFDLITHAVDNACEDDPASNVLPNFKKQTKGQIGILTTSNGAPVEITDTSSVISSNLMHNEFFMESLGHRLEENIPERVTHAKGSGAYGYLQVTHNITDICMASLFNRDGKKTPVAVRFSPTSAQNGEPDIGIDVRGFAIKFYTNEGNFDIVGVHTPIFIYKDPQVFTSITRIFQRNPVTNIKDQNILWDFICLKPEVLPFFLYMFGDNGLPDGYRHMPGFSVHTYQVYNKWGESYFVRFHFYPNGGRKNLNLKEAKKIGCSDPDYAFRDLYNAIENGDYPSWTIKLQVLSSEDVENCEFNPFDITKTLPEDKYPLRTLGQLVLNGNPLNYFAEMEQAAFCPGNLVRGILGAPDNAFLARRFAYKAAQRYRLGANFYNIPVNKPRNKIYMYERDGRAPVDNNGGEAPNYYPNSFHGPVPYIDKKRPELIKIKQYDDSYNFEQATERFIKLTNDEQQRLVENIVSSLELAHKSVQKRVLDLFKNVHPKLAFQTLIALDEKK